MKLPWRRGAARPPRSVKAGDDRRREIVTPEGLALTLTLASRGARAGALALDLLLMIVIAILTLAGVAWVFGGLQDSKVESSGPLQLLMIVLVIAAFVLRNGWFLIWELGPRGATPAKRLLGIRVAARDGARLTPEMVIARNLLRDIELALPIVFIAMAPTGASGAAGWLAAAWFLLFAAFPLFNRDRMRAGDVIAGTWVVESGKQKLAAALTAREDGTGYRFGEAELGVYGEHELKTLERVLREGRAETMWEVATAICAKIGWNPPGRDASQAFLEAYYRQLRARLETGMRFGRRKADKHAA